jgi:acyl-coenzyme A synthetase/AMP-(fatty) acid ligase
MIAGLTMLARRPRSEFVDDHCIEIIVGGGLTDEVVDTFRNEFGVKKLVKGFGMTEAPGTFGVPVEARQTRGSIGAPGICPGNRIPCYVVFADDLPRTPTSKVAKHSVKQDTALMQRAVDIR